MQSYKPNALEKAQNIGKLFLCVIEFNFASIHGSVLLIFSKTVKTVVAHMVLTPIPIRVQQLIYTNRLTYTDNFVYEKGANLLHTSKMAKE